MPPRAVPKPNIEYKFKFNKVWILIFEGVNEKGRYVFTNKQLGTFTSMSPKRFSYAHRYNLISETPIIKENKPSIIELERQKARQKRLEEEEKARKVREEIKVYIKQLKGLNNGQKEEVESIVQRSVEEMILELSKGTWSSRTAQEWYDIQHIVA